MKARSSLPNPNSSRGGVEPPLIILVEQYLADNSNMSYINIEHMVNSIRLRYHRFQRLPPKVFENQVRLAYHDYCRRNGQQGQPKQPSRPQGDPEISSSNAAGDTETDSDIEELEDESRIKPTQLNIVNQTLNKMYKSGNQKETVAGGSVAASSSTPSSSTPKQSAILDSAGNSNNARELDSSDDDLEIVDEVQGDASGVIKRTSEANDGQFGGLSHTPQQQLNRTGLSITLVNSKDIKFPVATPQKNSSTVSGAAQGQNIVPGRYQQPLAATPQRIAMIPIRGVPVAGGRVINKNDAAGMQKFDMSRGVKRKTTLASQSGGMDPDAPVKKMKKEITVVQDSGYRLSDFAGSEKVVEEVCRLLMHLKHPEVYRALGVTAPRGFLLHGPPGTGKTLLANAIAGELQLPMLKLTGTEFVSGISGESESNIRDLFTQALAIAPCIIFIDEIDSVTPKRENAHKEMERRIVAQLLSCVDDLMNHENGSQVLLIGATNRIESIDNSLRRAGRFDKEICLGIPDEKSREKILEVICRKIRLAPGFDLSILAKLTPGYVGADLQALAREAAVQAVNKALVISTSNRIAAERINAQILSEAAAGIIASSEGSGVEIIQENEKVNNEIPKYDVSTTEVMGLGNEIMEPTKSADNDETMVVEIDSNEKEGVTKSVDADTVQSAVEPGVGSTSNNVEPPTKNEKEDSSKEVAVDSMDVDGEIPVTSVDDAIIVEASTTTNVVVLDSTASTNEVAKENPDIENVVDLEGENTPQPDDATSSSNITTKPSAENMSNIGAFGNNSRLIQGVVEEEIIPSYFRWIKDTAPLSKSELDEMYIFLDDFEVALKKVQPSSKREGFATVPDTTWDDIGALADIREELEVSILGPIKHSAAFNILGLTSPAGVLLCGPPGCGKTLLAKAVANEAGINFISVRGPELLNMYVGESERAVRQCFQRAKNSSPCVIFFDEIDALCPRRSQGADSGSGSRIVNQLLTEMDGMECRIGVFVMAATNRPDILDPAILRPGRLDKILFVDLPTATDRFEILKALTKNGTVPLLADDVDLKSIAERNTCDNYTGADLAALIREASIAAFKHLVLDNKGDASQCVATDLKVSTEHFETAFLKTKPSVTKQDRAKYAEMKERYSNTAGR